MPGFGPYAPSATPSPFGTGSAPGVGSQITITSSVPGLPAGTYTLLPSFYGLLPGAFRVEIDSKTPTLLAGTNSLLDGSFQVNAVQSVANTTIRSAQPVVATVSSGAAVRTFSQFDEESFSQFVTAQAALTGRPRPALPDDAGTLGLEFTLPTPPSQVSTTATPLKSALTFNGTTLFQPAADGAGGTVVMLGATPFPLEITSDGTPTPGFTGVSIGAAQLDAVDATDLSIGGIAVPSTSEAGVDDFSAAFNQLPNSKLPTTGSSFSQIIIRDGAELRAPEVFLIGQSTLEAGSIIDTVGAGPVPTVPGVQPIYQNLIPGSGSSPRCSPSSNLNLQFLPANGGNSISVGGCDANPACQPTDVVHLDSEGSITFDTTGAVTLSSDTRIGSATITFDVANVNIGSDAAIATANAPAGLPFSQTLLNEMLAGDPGFGAPPLQSLTLSASQSVNFYGTVSLDAVDPQTGAASLGQLVLETPALYGFGGPGDVATLDVGTLVWSGLTSVQRQQRDARRAAADPGRRGRHRDRHARYLGAADHLRLSCQYADAGSVPLERTILGFSNVDLTASQSVSSNNNNTLAVYPGTGTVPERNRVHLHGRRADDHDAAADRRSRLDLAVTAGSAVTVQAPQGGPGAVNPAGLGGEIDFTGPAVSLNTTVSLPGGKLTATASQGDVVLGPQTDIDLAGRLTGLFDQTVANAGGTLVLSSAAGNVTAAPGSVIDVSAPGANAGSITATAAQGVVALDGTLSGAAGSGFTGGSLAVTTGSMSQDAFDALNANLNADGFFGARSFDIKTGDLDIGLDPATQQAELQARLVTVSLDGGNLQVDGPVNASGALPGTIDLSASGNLTVTGTGVLDAHSTVLQVDSSGQPIDASNAPQVVLTSANGVLTLASGASVNVSSADGVPRGQIELNVPRGGDVGISAAGPVTIQGAASIALNAFQIYTPGTEGLLANGMITQADIDAIGADNTAFIDAALTDANLLGRIAGLTSYGATFHLRPGDEIESSAASGGNLTVSGDIDLSGLRTNGLDPANDITAVPGSGEPGVLVVRAANDLNVFGSITDGFAPPPATPDDDGWVLSNSTLTSNFIVPPTTPSPLVLRGGTSGGTKFGNSGVLTYNLPITPATGAPLTLAAGATVPVVPAGSAPVTLAAAGTVTSSFVTTGSITLPNGTVVAAGHTVPAGTVLPVGTVLGAGATLPIAVNIAAVTWPAGVSLSAFAGQVTLASNLTMQPGWLIPVGTLPRFNSGLSTFRLRAPAGVSPMRPAMRCRGWSTSWRRCCRRVTSPGRSRWWRGRIWGRRSADRAVGGRAGQPGRHRQPDAGQHPAQRSAYGRSVLDG